MPRRDWNETSPPSISASGSGRCRAAGGLADCASASLSDAAGAFDRAVRSRWCDRHYCAAHRASYTLLYVTTANAVSATLFDKLNFNFIRDIAPVAAIVRFPYIMVVNPSVPAKTLPEFIAYAKANPGKINMASPGIGSTPHVNGELFKVMTGTNMVHVPYRSAAAVMTDLLSGQVQLYFGTTASSLEYVRTGKLRALAVTIERRLDALPDIPTVGDFVPGYEATNWYGIGAPRNTPVEVIEKLNKETNAGLADPKIKARIADLGGSVLTGSPADFGRLIADETEKWGKVVKFVGIKAD
jgi:tripartite-type tricarboxylate transporter receptor subunit TctC